MDTAESSDLTPEKPVRPSHTGSKHGDLVALRKGLVDNQAARLTGRAKYHNPHLELLNSFMNLGLPQRFHFDNWRRPY
jgi:hypothetical protein